MGRILIIDDDVNFSQVLKKRLQHHFHDDIIVYNQVTEELLNGHLWDLVFLDIEMGNINGIDIAKQLKRKQRAPLVIFVSNKEGLIHNTLEVQPFYFIRKNFLDTDINSALSLLRSIKFRIREMIQIKEDVLDIQDIIYVESSNHIVTVTMTTSKIMYRMTLEEISKLLKPYLCIRIHRSFIINMRYIDRWYSNRVILKDGLEIEIGRKFQMEAKRCYQEAKLDGFI